jgi:hypothetical protein
MRTVQYQQSYSELLKKRLGKGLLILFSVLILVVFITSIAPKISSNLVVILVIIVFGIILIRYTFITIGDIYVEYRKAKYGVEGENLVKEELSKFFDDSYVYISNFIIPETKIGDIDGILIGPKGLFIIEVKNWAGRFRISSTDMLRHLKGDIFKLYRKNAFYQIGRQVNYLKKYFKNKNIDIDIIPTFVLVDGKIETIVGETGIFVCELNKLINHLFEFKPKPEFTKEFCDSLVNVLIPTNEFEKK